jgi:hypothetical protein
MKARTLRFVSKAAEQLRKQPISGRRLTNGSCCGLAHPLEGTKARLAADGIVTIPHYHGPSIVHGEIVLGQIPAFAAHDPSATSFA